MAAEYILISATAEDDEGLDVTLSKLKRYATKEEAREIMKSELCDFIKRTLCGDYNDDDEDIDPELNDLFADIKSIGSTSETFEAYDREVNGYVDDMDASVNINEPVHAGGSWEIIKAY